MDSSDHDLLLWQCGIGLGEKLAAVTERAPIRTIDDKNKRRILYPPFKVDAKAAIRWKKAALNKVELDGRFYNR